MKHLDPLQEFIHDHKGHQITGIDSAQGNMIECEDCAEVVFSPTPAPVVKPKH